MFLPEGRKVLAVVGLVALLGVAACGDDDDDGAAVRESGDGSGSASASGAGSASASGSGAHAEGAECEYVGSSDAAPTGWVDITLTEYALDPVPAEIPAGTIEFIARNEGTETHELVIVRFDGDAGELPVDEHGAADESQLPDDAEIMEIEGFAGGQICAAAFDLEPGRYALFCNIVEEEESGETEAHYAEGMHTNFTVT